MGGQKALVELCLHALSFHPKEQAAALHHRTYLVFRSCERWRKSCAGWSKARLGKTCTTTSEWRWSMVTTLNHGAILHNPPYPVPVEAVIATRTNIKHSSKIWRQNCTHFCSVAGYFWSESIPWVRVQIWETWEKKSCMPISSGWAGDSDHPAQVGAAATGRLFAAETWPL